MKFSMYLVYHVTSLQKAGLGFDLVKYTHEYQEIADTLDLLVKCKARLSHPQITQRVEEYRSGGSDFGIETGVQAFRFLVTVEQFRDLERIPELLKELGWN